MGILHSLIRMPCLASASSSSSPASSTSSSTKAASDGPFARDKGRASPTKADISHPYPLAPRSASRASTESAAPSSLFRARSPRLPHSPLSTVTPPAHGSKRRRQPGRAATSPDTRLEPGLVASVRISAETRSDRLPESHRGHITFDAQPHPRSITSSPALYTPPGSITSLVPHSRDPSGLRDTRPLSDVLGVGDGGTSRRKLRKILRVEGDWEVVREGDCVGSEPNGPRTGAELVGK